MDDFHLLDNRRLARLARAQQEDLALLLEPTGVLLELSVYGGRRLFHLGSILHRGRGEAGTHDCLVEWKPISMLDKERLEKQLESCPISSSLVQIFVILVLACPLLASVRPSDAVD